MPESAPTSGDVLDLPSDLSSSNRSVAPALDGIMPGMAEIAGRKLGEETKAFGETERRMEEDRGRMTAAMAASGLEAEKLKPWNHDEESRRRTADPLEAFGSLGSVFGILASAFTRTPMENALNASAAAMNAVKAANDEDYKKAYDAYKFNMQLVEKRHAMIQAQFNDASALFRTDMQAGTVKAQNIATRFGDEQSLFLLSNGMNKEFFDLQAQRNKAALEMSEATRKITENTFREQVFRNIVAELPEEKRNDPASQMRAWNYAHGMNSKTEEDVMMQWWAEHPGAKAEDAAKFAAKFKADQHAAATIATPDRMDAKEIERRRDQYVQEGLKPNEAYDKASKEVREIAAANKRTAAQTFTAKWYEEHPDGTPEEFSAAFQKFMQGQKPPGTTGGNVNLTGDRQRAQDVAKYRENLKTSTDPDTGEKYTDEKVGELAAKYEAKLKATATPPSGNQRDTLRSMIDRTVNFEQTIDKVEGILAKHNLTVGLGGKVTRPAEAFGNAIGVSGETDRKQVERWIAEMKEWAPRILNESKGRPLAAEAAQVNSIVAGMSFQDTTANVVRAYRELRPLIQKIREDLVKRESGTWEAPKPGAAPAGAAKPKWMDAPVIGPRSDAGAAGTEMTA